MSILIDAHVHYHDCFDLQTFLEFASSNVRRGVGHGQSVIGCLMLAETDSGDPARRIKDRAGRIHRPWSLAGTTQCGSLICLRDGRPELVLLPGRQVVTDENLEVLALGTDGAVRPGRPLKETLDETAQAGAMAVLPWGFGKWWFRRGRAVHNAVLSRASDVSEESWELFLGDNGGRLQWGPPPRPFAMARRLGMRILPGSDPLPFPSQISRVGSYGFVLPGSLDFDRPCHCIRTLLRQMSGQPAIYGRRERVLRFCRFQVAMQIRKLSTRVRRCEHS